MHKAFMGVDPGKTGGIVVIDSKRKILMHETVPIVNDDYDLHEMLKLAQRFTTTYNISAVIEKQLGFAMQQISTTLIGYGMWRAVLKLSLLVLYEATPNEWPKLVVPKDFSKLSYSERKKKNALLAQELFPDWKPKSIGEVKSQADAFLIAEFARQKELDSDFKAMDKIPELPEETTKTVRSKRTSKQAAEDFFLGD